MPNRLRAVALAVGLALAADAASAAPCFRPEEARASQVRQLQTELMVAALACQRHPTLDLAGKYNEFIRRHGGLLVENARVLRGFFARSYGAAEGRRFDGYITSLANAASKRSLTISGYCESMDPLFDGALTAPTSQIESLALTQLTPVRLIGSCGEPTRAAKAKRPPATVKVADDKTSAKN